MNKYSILSALIFILLGTSCAEEKQLEVEVENVEIQTTETKEVAKTKNNIEVETQTTETKEVAKTKNNIVVDFKEFPKNSAGKEIWTSKIKEGKPDVKVVKDKDLKIDVLRLRSDEASYFYQKELKNVNLDKNGIVSWKWKVTKNPKGGDVRKRSTDDQAIQVLLAFEGKYIISYIWDPTAPVGYSKDASIPFFLAQKVIVLESGEKNINKWMEIRRDVKADFKKLYGKDAPKLGGVAVQINSQHTESKCESFVSPIVFEEK